LRAGTRRKEGTQKRKLGRNPRIPFSSSQVSVLEQRFKQSQYLSSSDVAELANYLNLSETRVSRSELKIFAAELKSRDSL
jgi:homeobox protein MSX